HQNTPGQRVRPGEDAGKRRRTGNWRAVSGARGGWGRDARQGSRDHAAGVRYPVAAGLHRATRGPSPDGGNGSLRPLAGVPPPPRPGPDREHDMSPSLIVIQLLSGLAHAMVLFLIASGLSLI